MPDSDVVQFKSPTTGKVQAIPPEHWDEAIKAGYAPTTHKVMYSPEGKRGMVANEDIADHAKQGYQTTPETQLEKNAPQRGITEPLDPNAQGVTQRFLGSAGAALLSAPGAIIRAGMDPVGTAKDIARGVGSSAAAWANPATRPTWEGIKSVLPEALGGGVGNVAAGYVPEAAVGAKELAGTALRNQYNEVRGPIKGLASLGKLFGGPEITDALIPNRPGAYSAAERAAVPLSQMPDAEHLGQINAARRSAYQPTVPPEPELGSPENPGYMSKLPTRLPPRLRGDPFSPAAPPPEPPPTYPGASEPSYEEYAANRGKDIMAARKLQPDAFAPPEPPATPQPFMSKLPTRLPPNLRGDPFAPTPPAYQSPLGDTPSEEGVAGSVPKPSGRLVVLPQEAQALDQLQRIATRRASQMGMQYAAGMRPAGGGRVPITPTGIRTMEYPGPRAEVDTGSAYAPSSSLQGNPSPFAPTAEEELAEMARRRKPPGANTSGLL